MDPEELKKQKNVIDLSGLAKEKPESQVEISQPRPGQVSPASASSPATAEPEVEESSFLKKFRKEKAEKAIVLPEPSYEKVQYDIPSVALTENLKIRFGKFLRWGLWFLVPTAFLGVALVLTFYFPGATVVLRPRVDKIVLPDPKISLDVSASGIRLSGLVLPVERLEFDKSKSQEFASSGEKVLNERSFGKVLIFNNFSSAPQTLVKSTRLESPEGVIVRIQRSITVPGAEVRESKIVPKSVEVEVLADLPGEKGNLGDGITLKIPGFKGGPKFEGFYGVTSGALKGGMVGMARVVTVADLKNGQEKVTTDIYKDLEDEIVSKVPPGFVFTKQLRNIEIEAVEVPVLEEPREKFTVSARGVARVMVFRESDLMELLNGLLKGAGAKEILDNSLKVSYQVRSVDFEKGKAEITVSGEAKEASVIEVDKFKAEVAGKKEGSIVEVLRSHEELSSFKLSFFPPWILRAPEDRSKIEVKVEYE